MRNNALKCTAATTIKGANFTQCMRERERTRAHNNKSNKFGRELFCLHAVWQCLCVQSSVVKLAKVKARVAAVVVVLVAGRAEAQTKTSLQRALVPARALSCCLSHSPSPSLSCAAFVLFIHSRFALLLLFSVEFDASARAKAEAEARARNRAQKTHAISRRLHDRDRVFPHAKVKIYFVCAKKIC